MHLVLIGSCSPFAHQLAPSLRPAQLRARSPPCIPVSEGFRLVAASVSQPARALNDSQRRSLARVRRDTLLTSLANA